MPGPACYGKGTLPTVTDANLVLGRLDPDAFLGGGMHLNRGRARNALRTPQFSVERFAEGIIELTNSHMVQALRRISVEQGHDPRDFTLVSYGGAGPLHACELARALQIPRVLIPNFPGALSAYGILLSDVVRDRSKTVMLKPGDSAIEAYAPHWLDIRYKGQGYELRVAYTSNYQSAFHELHQQRYGYSDANREIEIVNVRWRDTTKTDKPVSARFTPEEGKAVGKATKIYAEGAWHEGQIYARANLKAGYKVSGPAVITEYSATTYLPPNTKASVDEWLNLVVEVA